MVSDTKPQQRAQSDKQKTADGKERPFGELRRLLAELLGTFTLTFVAAGGTVIYAVTNGAVGDAARYVAPGLVIMAMTYCSNFPKQMYACMHSPGILLLLFQP